jgi:hypothetical protein
MTVQPCTHDQFLIDCEYCWFLVHHPEGRRIQREKSGRPLVLPTLLRAADQRPAGSLPADRPPCVHEGAVVERCRSCGTGRLDVRECDVHGKCIRDSNDRGVQSCVACNDYRSPNGPPSHFTRHLAYYVCPMGGTGTWQRNLDQLIARMDLFDGRRVVCVATKGKLPTVPLDPPEMVEDYLAGRGCEFVRIQNDKRLREVVAWDHFWLRMPTGPRDVTFFAHAKGVRHPANAGVTVHTWTTILYETLLDYWPLIEKVLTAHPLAGSFKRTSRAFNGVPWHYSGTFLWVRNADFFVRNWRGGIPRKWWGTEGVWGKLYAAHEGGLVFKTGAAEMDLYTMPVMTRVLEEYEQWKSEQKQSHSPIGSSASLSPAT